MKLIEQSCDIIFQQYPVDVSDFKDKYIQKMYKHIEFCGRICYHSLDKMTDSSAEAFVARLIKSKHTSVLEHGTIYLTRPLTSDSNYYDLYSKYSNNPYSRCNIHKGMLYITTNYRVIIENNWEKDLEFLSFPTEHHYKRHTLKCTTALHCYKDLTRHRTFSFSIESTRYCNYSNTDKFGEMSFIKPTWVSNDDTIFIDYLKTVEKIYNELMQRGWKAQQAAEVLPQCIKSNMVMTGYDDDWKRLIDIRYYGITGAPHPMVKELASLMKKNLEKADIIETSLKEND